MEFQDSSFLRQLARLTADHKDSAAEATGLSGIGPISPARPMPPAPTLPLPHDAGSKHETVASVGSATRGARTRPSASGSEQTRNPQPPPAWIPPGKARGLGSNPQQGTKSISSPSSAPSRGRRTRSSGRTKASPTRQTRDPDAYHRRPKAVREAEQDFERTLQSVRNGSLLHPGGASGSVGASAQSQSHRTTAGAGHLAVVPTGHAAVLDAFREQVQSDASHRAHVMAEQSREQVAALRRRIETLLGTEVAERMDAASRGPAAHAVDRMAKAAADAARQAGEWTEQLLQRQEQDAQAGEEALREQAREQSERLLTMVAIEGEKQREARLDAVAQQLVEDKDTALQRMEDSHRSKGQRAEARLREEAELRFEEAVRDLRTACERENDERLGSLREQLRQEHEQRMADARSALEAAAARAESELEERARQEHTQAAEALAAEAMRQSEERLAGRRKDIADRLTQEREAAAVELRAALEAQHQDAVQEAEADLTRRKDDDLRELQGALKQAQAAEIEALEVRMSRDREAELEAERQRGQEKLEAAKAAASARIDAETARAMEALRNSLDSTRQRVLEEHEKDAEEEGRKQLESLRAAVVGDMDEAIRAVRQSKALEYSRRLNALESDLRKTLRERVSREHEDWLGMRRKAESLLRECAEWAAGVGRSETYPASGGRLRRAVGGTASNSSDSDGEDGVSAGKGTGLSPSRRRAPQRRSGGTPGLRLKRRFQLGGDDAYDDDGDEEEQEQRERSEGISSARGRGQRIREPAAFSDDDSDGGGASRSGAPRLRSLMGGSRGGAALPESVAKAVDRAQKYLDSLSQTCDEHRARRVRAEERIVLASKRLLLVKRQAQAAAVDASELQSRLDATADAGGRTFDAGGEPGLYSDADESFARDASGGTAARAPAQSRSQSALRTSLVRQAEPPAVPQEVLNARLARSEQEKSQLKRAVQQLTDANKQLLQRSLVEAQRSQDGNTSRSSARVPHRGRQPPAEGAGLANDRSTRRDDAHQRGHDETRVDSTHYKTSYTEQDTTDGAGWVEQVGSSRGYGKGAGHGAAGTADGLPPRGPSPAYQRSEQQDSRQQHGRAGEMRHRMPSQASTASSVASAGSLSESQIVPRSVLDRLDRAGQDDGRFHDERGRSSGVYQRRDDVSSAAAALRGLASGVDGGDAARQPQEHQRRDEFESVYSDRGRSAIGRSALAAVPERQGGGSTGRGSSSGPRGAGYGMDTTGASSAAAGADFQGGSASMLAEARARLAAAAAQAKQDAAAEPGSRR